MTQRSRSLAFAAFAFALAPLCASAIPVELNITAIRTIQAANPDQGDKPDQVYLLVNGVAAGKDINARFPQDKTLTSAPQQQPIDKPLTVWKGDLDNGQFALLSITLMQGDGKDQDKIKQYLANLEAADKKPADVSKPSLTAEQFRALAGLTDIKRPKTPDYVKAQRDLIKKIKETFPGQGKSDHFGGLFTILVWNDNGKLTKRLDPVGLTFGEHFGVDPKTYTKLKNTRGNVQVKDDTGDWSNQALPPLTDDQATVRVKMLDTEEPKGPDSHHVTDYLVECQLLTTGGAKPEAVQWSTGGEVSGIDDIHTYWEFAY